MSDTNENTSTETSTLNTAAKIAGGVALIGFGAWGLKKAYVSIKNWRADKALIRELEKSLADAKEVSKDNPEEDGKE